MGLAGFTARRQGATMAAKIEKKTNRKRGETMGRCSPVSVLAGAQGLPEVAGVRRSGRCSAEVAACLLSRAFSPLGFEGEMIPVVDTPLQRGESTLITKGGT